MEEFSDGVMRLPRIGEYSDATPDAWPLSGLSDRVPHLFDWTQGDAAILYGQGLLAL
jgi:hypothetical protein